MEMIRRVQEAHLLMNALPPQMRENELALERHRQATTDHQNLYQMISNSHGQSPWSLIPGLQPVNVHASQQPGAPPDDGDSYR